MESGMMNEVQPKPVGDIRLSPTSQSLWMTLSTGKRLAILFNEDQPGELTVRALDGPLLVCPQASNTVRLKPI